MDVVNRFADGEDAYQNKRTRSPEDDRSNRYNNQRRQSRNYDNYGSHSQIATSYKDNNYQSNDRRNSGIAMITEMTWAATGISGQVVQEITTNCQMICSMDRATCIIRMSMVKDYQGTQ
jgi:hypothetical protein